MGAFEFQEDGDQNDHNGSNGNISVIGLVGGVNQSLQTYIQKHHLQVALSEKVPPRTGPMPTHTAKALITRLM